MAKKKRENKQKIDEEKMRSCQLLIFPEVAPHTSVYFSTQVFWRFRVILYASNSRSGFNRVDYFTHHGGEA